MNRSTLEPETRQHWLLRNGEPVWIRPICPEDEPLMVQFHQSLSEESVYLRYAHLIKLSHRVSHDRLSRICHAEPDHEIVLVAEHPMANGTPEIIAVARLNKLPEEAAAEFALVISDAYQHQSLGHKLLDLLLNLARKANLQRVFGEILPENHAMLHLCHTLGFHLHCDLLEGIAIAEITP